MKKRKLNMRRSYASNRLWKNLLPEVYAKLIPIKKHTIDYGNEQLPHVEKVNLIEYKEQH